VLNNLKARRDREEGFTLIELMVVVLIIAILIAIAIPTFLGARERAQNRAAQSSLRNALTAAKTAYTDVSDYTTAGAGVVGPPATELTAIEPSLTFVNTASADPKTVSVLTDALLAATPQTWAAAAWSKGGTCYYLKDVASGAGAGTSYGSTTVAADCTGAKAAAMVTNTPW
jgi:type IV pilus assembly protein PilA